MAYLRKRGDRFHFRKKVPTIASKLISQSHFQIPLDTDSREIAQERALYLNVLFKEFLADLTTMDVASAEAKFYDAVTTARLCGFKYLSVNDIAKSEPIAQVVNRVNAAHGSNNLSISKAVLGGLGKPNVTLSKALDSFIEHETGNLTGMSDDQIRKWKNPRKKAVSNFIEVIGDKPLESITREDILFFRDWWVKRIDKNNMSTDSANKNFAALRKILDTASANFELDISVDNLFRKTNLKKVEKTRRFPFETSFIKNVLLNRDVIGLNEEAHLLMFAMCDTGARISELTGLSSSDVILDADVPHIKIRPNEIRGLKTKQSERDIPLVGASLYAFQTLGGTFDQYLGKAELISNTVNKYCRENDVFPSGHYSLYSFRHSFEDRLTAVEPPDKVQAALMGHKYSRPRYGHGPSLEQKKSWLDQIAIEV